VSAHTIDVVVGGWIEPRGSRPFFGALLLGVPEAGGLRYVGQTSTGISDAELGKLWKQLQGVRTRSAPFESPLNLRGGARAHWAKPRLRVTVAHDGWTASGLLRRPVYQGISDTRAHIVARIGSSVVGTGSRVVGRIGSSYTSRYAPHAKPLAQAADRK
jgi:ATP-dependent DNA ligase